MSSPSSGRRHSSRLNYDNTRLNYSASYHPIDKVIRPKQAARKLKRAEGAHGSSLLIAQEQSTSSPAKYGRTAQLNSPRKKHSTPTRMSNPVKPRGSQMKIQSEQRSPYDMTWHPIDDFDDLQQRKSRPRVVINVGQADGSQVQPSSITSRRTPNVSPISGNTILGPTSVAERKLSNAPTPVYEDHDTSVERQAQRFDTTPPLASVQHSKPADTAIVMDLKEQVSNFGWTSMPLSDEQLYLTGKGAALGSELFRNASPNMRASSGRATQLELVGRLAQTVSILPEKRYEAIRLGLDMFFNTAAEIESKKNWDVLRAEGLDVYDMETGEKYWRHDADRHVVSVEKFVARGSSGSGDALEALSDDFTGCEGYMMSTEQDGGQHNPGSLHSAEAIDNLNRQHYDDPLLATSDDVGLQILTDDAIPCKWQAHPNNGHLGNSFSVQDNLHTIRKKKGTGEKGFAFQIHEDGPNAVVRKLARSRHILSPADDMKENNQPQSSVQDRPIEDDTSILEEYGDYDDLPSMF